MKKQLVEMRPVSLKLECQTMDLPQALDWARGRMDPARAWLLAQCPEGVIWQSLARPLETGQLENCLLLYIFDSRTELRLQKVGASFYCRQIWEEEGAEQGLLRTSSYRLRNEPRRLKYGEFFQPNPESGILELRFGRFYGVEEGAHEEKI